MRVKFPFQIVPPATRPPVNCSRDALCLVADCDQNQVEAANYLWVRTKQGLPNQLVRPLHLAQNARYFSTTQKIWGNGVMHSASAGCVLLLNGPFYAIARQASRSTG